MLVSLDVSVVCAGFSRLSRLTRALPEGAEPVEGHSRPRMYWSVARGGYSFLPWWLLVVLVVVHVVGYCACRLSRSRAGSNQIHTGGDHACSIISVSGSGSRFTFPLCSSYFLARIVLVVRSCSHECSCCIIIIHAISLSE